MSPPRPPRTTPSDELLEERPGVHLEVAKASGQDLAPAEDLEADEAPRVCPLCETGGQELGPGETPGERGLQTATSSPAAVALGGGGLQIDGHDAQRWLDRRAAWIEAETRAGRLETATLDVSDLRLHPDLSDLRLHPDLSDEGN